MPVPHVPDLAKRRGCAPPTATSTSSSPSSTSAPTWPTSRWRPTSCDNVLVYDADRLAVEVGREHGADAVAAELVRALTDGPGVVAIRGAFPDTAVVDRATARLRRDDRRREAPPAAHVGDHFAKAGANDRVWNALEKLAVRDPETFVDYYANDIIALVSRAWLGPGYQVTSQVNVVRPGGQAQDPHRDYHLGFLENDVVEQYPTHVHLLSPVLTLQGAVAHSDMPVESGPTMYLPYSHQYVPGYLAWRLPEFRAYFARALRPAAAGQGRRRLLQPGPVPRRRHQRLRRHPAGRQPAPGLLRVRSRDGGGGPGPRDPGGLPGAPRAARPRASRRSLAQRARLPPPRATRSRPTSTSTSPSAGSPPASQAEIVAPRSRAGTTPEDSWRRCSTSTPLDAPRRPRTMSLLQDNVAVGTLVPGRSTDGHLFGVPAEVDAEGQRY